jgi:hypothetical protein
MPYFAYGANLNRAPPGWLGGCRSDNGELKGTTQRPARVALRVWFRRDADAR